MDQAKIVIQIPNAFLVIAKDLQIIQLDAAQVNHQATDGTVAEILEDVLILTILLHSTETIIATLREMHNMSWQIHFPVIGKMAGKTLEMSDLDVQISMIL